MKAVTESAIRVRFAPSPTGHLHIGGLRTALFNDLFARHNGGKFLLRIEDTDRERSRDEYTASILSSLRWAGILWDEVPVIQSERIAIHQQVIEQLVQRGKAYRCYCSTEAVAERFKKSDLYKEGAEFIRYDGLCRTAGSAKTGPSVVRFKLPDCATVVFEDLIRGRVEFRIQELDDFIIARSDGFPMYNFVVVVDDAAMNITHVIRGEDHISNTPKQILLYEACEYQIPQFAHLPLILGPDGNRLSKRDAATAVTDYREKGYLPQALINYLVRLGWAHGDQEVFSRQELISLFSIEAVGKKGAIFNEAKLDWLNSVYLKEQTAPQLLDIIVSDVEPQLYQLTSQWMGDERLRLIDLYKTREKTLADVAGKIVELYTGPSVYDSLSLDTWVTDNTASVLLRVSELFARVEWTEELLSSQVKAWCKEEKIQLVTVAQAMRIALTGSSASPGIFELLVILGRQVSGDRIQNFLNFLSDRF